MRQLALLIALIAAAPAWAGGNETSFPVAPDGTVLFVTPSGNIGCLYMPAGGTATYATLSGQEELHCTRVAPTYTVVILDHAQDHPAAIASGEVPGLDAGPVLPYGRFWQHGGFTCLSATSGLTCINSTGAGLRMARAGVTTW